MRTLVTFVPAASTEAVLEALFAAGAGRLGDYDRCAFVVRGEGRFRPLAGADPAIGRVGADERVAEDRLECLVADENVDAAIAALRRSHPYEEPAVHLYALDDRCLGGPPRAPGA
jgi:hypothetical protein